jgi:hypothetical protein
MPEVSRAHDIDARWNSSAPWASPRTFESNNYQREQANKSCHTNS